MTEKVVCYTITHCNGQCRYFYHKFEDYEHCYCTRLNRKIFDCGDEDDVFWDLTLRDIPKDCPLKDANTMELDLGDEE
jgi:hypothetical protein